MLESTLGRVRQKLGALVLPLVLVLGLLLWLWPIGAGGKMPIGGDVTSFSIGLMAELSRALRAGRIPFWNDLWGYGFPGLAESQMGVFYPPHALLYRCMPVEWAYTASLLLHTFWAGLGAWWAAKAFGVSKRGAAVSGYAFGTCGFFLVHLTHQWGATTGSWMPWAWGLAWRLSRGEGRNVRNGLWLSAVLALQMLPGHFQLAFITQVTTALVLICGLVYRLEISDTVPASRVRRLMAVLVCLIGVVPLALAQLAPTAELAKLASSQRSVEYLSAFATPPTHLVSYVAPGLFHMSPLWRPLAWDAFHAMPEEHLATIGLVPLFMAMLALRRRRESGVGTLIWVALIASALSLGPFLPGFSVYCQLPGFSFFRAPARWGAAAMLALSLLAGIGFDVWPTLMKPGRQLRFFTILASLLLGLIVGLIELSFYANEPDHGKPSVPIVSEEFDAAFQLFRWQGEPQLSELIKAANQPQSEPRVIIAHARQGLPVSSLSDISLSKQRKRIYIQELGPTLILLTGLIFISFFGKSGMILLCVVMPLESWIWGWQRPFDVGPIEPLTQQSLVLHQLSGFPRGTRSIDDTKNLSMISGVAGVQAYRTLDLPVMPDLTRIAAAPMIEPMVGQALRAIGVGVRVELADAMPLNAAEWDKVATVKDPALFGWQTTSALAKNSGPRTPDRYTLWRPKSEPARAWFVSAGLSKVQAANADPKLFMNALDRAKPLPWHDSRPEDISMDFDASEPGSVVIAQLYYPRWKATLNDEPVAIERVGEGWQGVNIAKAGGYVLRLTYDTKPDWIAMGISGFAWLGWLGVYRMTRKHKAAGDKNPPVNEAVVSDVHNENRSETTGNEEQGQ